MTIHFGDGSSQTAAGLAGSGKIIQVQHSEKTDTASTTSGWTDTRLSRSITPSSSSNKIIVSWGVNWSAAGSAHVRIRVQRGGTTICHGNSDGSNRIRLSAGGYTVGNQLHMCGGSYTDSPSTTSSIDYHIEFGRNSGTAYINRNRYTNDASYAIRGASFLTLMEVSG